MIFHMIHRIVSKMQYLINIRSVVRINTDADARSYPIRINAVSDYRQPQILPVQIVL